MRLQRDRRSCPTTIISCAAPTFDFQRSDGAWQTQTRESYDIGDAAAVLPDDQARDRVILIKQFRWPVFEWGYRQLLVEAIAGKLDGDTPKTCIIREAMEEAGVTITNPRLVSHCFVSPGAVKERVSLFLADYDFTAPRAKGGGHEAEGEDIDVLELTPGRSLGHDRQRRNRRPEDHRRCCRRRSWQPLSSSPPGFDGDVFAPVSRSSTPSLRSSGPMPITTMVLPGLFSAASIAATYSATLRPSMSPICCTAAMMQVPSRHSL